MAAPPALSRYVARMLSKGYELSAIRNALQQAGYPPALIAEAMRYVPMQAHVRHTIHLSGGAIGALVIIGVLIAGGIFAGFTLLSGNKPAALLDMRVTILTMVPEAGQQLLFSPELFSAGAKQAVDVVVRYELIHIASRKAVAEKTETVAVQTRASPRMQLAIPDDAPAGDYLLRVQATYAGQSALASERFTIAKAASRQQGNPSAREGHASGTEPARAGIRSCDDGNTCTLDSFDGVQCVHESVWPCCGNGQCEAGEQGTCSDCARFQQNTLAPSAPAAVDCNGKEGFALSLCQLEQAKADDDLSLCAQIATESVVMDCYSALALQKRDSEVCERIGREDNRDVCYMNFITAGDYTVCGRLSREYIRNSCEQLRQLDEARR
ncbi:TPA: hypothetical protein HA361_00245 [Candidatus Woesearchaeota archaeon]|nr:hypothetical protein [Candidatus Woesearchaeota archaeon]HII69333.1 hypothetical protein [Candidatus Woesearchaeota archaeon]